MTDKVYSAPVLDSLSLRSTSAGATCTIDPTTGTCTVHGGGIHLHLGLGLPGLGS